MLLAEVVCLPSLWASSSPAVFPMPRQFEIRSEGMLLVESTPILLPEAPSADDVFLARFLTSELSDRYGIALRASRVATLPERGAFILLGSARNPLVQQWARAAGPVVAEQEGYRLEVDRNRAVVAGADDAGAFYGLQSLRQLIKATRREVRIQGASIKDWPFKPFRGIKLYLPGQSNIAYFKRFVRDVMALFKYNTMILEVNAGMRFDSHPELNAGWIELGQDLKYTRRDRSWGPGSQFQDSANADTADGGVLEKEEVAELVAFVRKHHIEVIPEIPSLTHAYYLLTRHRELAEIQDAEWPDTYCPSEPKVYDLLFDVMDEYIEVIKPAMVHIGHDEWRMPVGACPRCKGRDPTELFAADLNRIYSHLRTKGVQTAMWGDHLIEPLRGKKVKHVRNPRGTPYDMPGALSPEQVQKLIPKDILIFNWFWDSPKRPDGEQGLGEKNEIALSDWGFKQVYGNFQPHISDFDRRAARAGILGGAPSSWAATNELNFGKDLMYEFLGCANLLWSTDRPDMSALSVIVQERLPAIRARLMAVPLPSLDDASVPLDLKAGAGAVSIAKDVSSIIFLHACRKAGRNRAAYTGTWNFADTAELVGWYEVSYQDGFVETVPLRYGVNILEEGWLARQAPKDLAYEAEMSREKDGTVRFSFEWVNPRFGKVVREVRLRSVSESNPVLLERLSVVPARTAPEPKPLRLVP
jgi:hexosaminidase